MAGLSVSVQAAGSSKGAGDLRALSTEIRLELVVRVAEHLAGRADCAANRAGPATRVGGCSAIVRGQSLSEGAAAASARGAVAVLVCRAPRALAAAAPSERDCPRTIAEHPPPR